MKRVAWFALLMMGCIEPYVPPTLSRADAMLVIDGHIDPTDKSTIQLSRTQNLDETGAPEMVLNATVTLFNENGTQHTLMEEGNGQYTLEAFAIEPGKHMLRVNTEDGKVYSSELVDVVDSPPIDSISWDLTSESGVNISVNTHNPDRNTGYYRWKYEETWIYTSPLWSSYQYDDTIRDIVYRTEDIYHCWQSQSSTDLLITSSSRLSENAISKFPLVSIGQRDPRLRYAYSINVKQFAITEEAYSYWKELKKTTEDLGTLFSPMPSQVTGNFTCITNPEEKVLGFFSIGTSVEKRIFIDSKELPQPTSYNIPYQDCTLQTLSLSDVPTFNSAAYIIIDAIATGTTITAYLYSTHPCGDCRAAGGTNIKPDFWP